MAPPKVRDRPGRPPLRHTPKGPSYSQGRPHPSDPDYDGPAPAEPSTAPDAPGASPAPAAGTSGPPPSRGGMAEQASGALLALIAWPLLLNLVRGGPAQMWGWIKAKWINQPYGNAAPSGGTTTPTVSPQAIQQLQQPGTAAQLQQLGINPQQAANQLLQGTS